MSVNLLYQGVLFLNQLIYFTVILRYYYCNLPFYYRVQYHVIKVQRESIITSAEKEKKKKIHCFSFFLYHMFVCLVKRK